MSEPTNDASRAVTNVPEFFGELDGGQFERSLSAALSATAAAVVTYGKKGELTVKLMVEHIKGTHQVRIEHLTKYEHPTSLGSAGEKFSATTVMHVGRFGKLTIAQERLDGMGRQSSIPMPP